MKSCNDIQFLENYWREAKEVGKRVVKELPKLRDSSHKPKNGLSFIQFKDMVNWSVADNLRVLRGNSLTLEALADKINNMILKGRGNDVKVMVEKIISGRVKHFSKSPSKVAIKSAAFLTNSGMPQEAVSEPLGRGHFRWNNKAYLLTAEEINHIKKYFKM